MRIFHRHKWRYIAASVEPCYPGLNRTLVLMRCDCGRRRVSPLNGKWTLEQLLAKQPLPKETK